MRITKVKLIMTIQFGAKPTPQDLKCYAQSAYWDGSRFLNLEETTMDFKLRSFPQFLKKQLFDKQGREPNVKLPILPLPVKEFLAPSHFMKYCWYGHSVVLMRLNNQTILIDPMLGPNAAPISPLAVNRFSDNSIQLIDTFPDIDLMCLTHDHYDHIDYASITKLKTKVKKYYVALGVKRLLLKWGIEEQLITEFDWWETQCFQDIHIHFTPTRHFSGRGLTDRAKSLWGGWVFNTEQESIWFSGDGGYGKHFKTIGERFGSFDFAFMECGQYNEHWHQIHMYPEESVKAAMDVNAKKITPVHWAGFALAQHTWVEPADRFVLECEKQNVSYITPQLGELVNTSEATKQQPWWK